MLTYSNVYDSELRKLINTSIEMRKDELCSGICVFNMSDYSKRVVIIDGLRNALDLCDEAISAADRRERNL